MVYLPSLLGNRTIHTVEILNITLQEQTLSIAVCVPKAGPKSESALEAFQFQVKDQTQAAQWQANVLGHVYKGKDSIAFGLVMAGLSEQHCMIDTERTEHKPSLDVKRSKHFKVLVNPFGGQGHAKKLWEHIAEPLIKAAGCTYDLTCTP